MLREQSGGHVIGRPSVCLSLCVCACVYGYLVGRDCKQSKANQRDPTRSVRGQLGRFGMFLFGNALVRYLAISCPASTASWAMPASISQWRRQLRASSQRQAK